MAHDDTFDIKKLIARFANSFDLNDWDGLLACLAETVHTDYSDLRGTAPETVSASRYVQERRAALEKLKTHHLSGNYEIKYSDPLNATCRVSMVIWRKTETEVFNTHCIYTFTVAKASAGWKITAISQKVLWNEGQAAIHSGAK